jgi:plasmid stabilization system protein ParE
MHKQVRMALVRRFPYLVFYTPEANQITVFLIFHAARDPHMETAGLKL